MLKMVSNLDRFQCLQLTVVYMNVQVSEKRNNVNYVTRNLSTNNYIHTSVKTKLKLNLLQPILSVHAISF